MRIAINCRSILLPRRTGIGRYTYHLVDSLGQMNTSDDYVLYARKKLFDPKRRMPSFPYPNFKKVQDIFGLGPKRLFKKVSVYHVPHPDMVEPLPGVKLIVTIHDLIYKTHPQSHTPATVDTTAKQMAAVVEHADRIICVSQSTRADLHRFFDLPQHKTCVVHNGVDHGVFYPLDDVQRKEAALRLPALGIHKPFLLFVGTIEPRKNLIGLLKSFALLKSSKAFLGQLVVVGMQGWMMQSLTPLIKELGLGDDIVFAGFISDGQLHDLYNLTEVFVFPSFYEGFGFPMVEAFCCGAPVVASNTSSCGEIGKGAAIMIDPQDPQAMAHALAEILQDDRLRQKMRLDSLAQAQKFSFLKTAQETRAIYYQSCD